MLVVKGFLVSLVGPSDNSTDIYSLQNHTPPLFYPLDNDHRPSVNENGGYDPFEARRNTGTTLGAESNIPWNRASYSQQNRDMLFVVLGVVLGGVFIVVIFIIVFCLWRQRQHQLFLGMAITACEIPTSELRKLF